MLLKINGVPVTETVCEAPVNPLVLAHEEQVEKAIQRVGKFLIPSSISAGVFSIQTLAFAEETKQVAGESLISGLWPLIELLQSFAFPVGVGIAIWGIIEMMATGSPTGIRKIKLAIIGYVGIFLVPYLFEQIRLAFQGMGHL